MTTLNLLIGLLGAAVVVALGWLYDRMKNDDK